MINIDCKGKDGTIVTFEYESEQKDFLDGTEWVFRIYPLDKRMPDFFEFCITRIDEKTGKVTMMHHHNQSEYRAKGIPERMIEEAHKVLKLQIISSTNSKTHKVLVNEYITESAKKVWERLVDRGKAFFDNQRKVYIYKP
jgi:hypothetical protein